MEGDVIYLTADTERNPGSRDLELVCSAARHATRSRAVHLASYLLLGRRIMLQALQQLPPDKRPTGLEWAIMQLYPKAVFGGRDPFRVILDDLLKKDGNAEQPLQELVGYGNSWWSSMRRWRYSAASRSLPQARASTADRSSRPSWRQHATWHL